MRRTTVVALLVASAGSAAAQPYDRTWTSCLRKPDLETVARDCTVVIESGKATATERAIALNNRAMASTVPEAVVRDLDEAIRLAPSLAKLYVNRGHCHSDTPALALEDFATAIRLDPKYAVAYNARADFYASFGRHVEAIRDFDQAIRLAPRYMHPMYNPYEFRARSKEAIGDLKGAEADRAAYMGIMSPESEDDRNPNVRGPRSWEFWVTK